MRRSAIQTAAPATEPISLEEAKSHLRIEPDDTGSDADIEAMIAAARQKFEIESGQALITQQWILALSCWPQGKKIRLPNPPLQSVQSVIYYDENDQSYQLSSAMYEVDTMGEPGELLLRAGRAWPVGVTLRSANPVQVAFTAGYGDASAVPQVVKRALLLTIGHWYENREEVLVGAGLAAAVLPQGAQTVVNLMRRYV